MFVTAPAKARPDCAVSSAKNQLQGEIMMGKLNFQVSTESTAPLCHISVTSLTSNATSSEWSILESQFRMLGSQIKIPAVLQQGPALVSAARPSWQQLHNLAPNCDCHHH